MTEHQKRLTASSELNQPLIPRNFKDPDEQVRNASLSSGSSQPRGSTVLHPLLLPIVADVLTPFLQHLQLSLPDCSNIPEAM